MAYIKPRQKNNLKINSSAKMILCAVSLLTLGCSALANLPEVSIMEAHEIPLDKGEYYGLAWVDSDRLVTGRSDSEELSKNISSWILRSDGSEFNPINLPDVNGCRDTFYQYPTHLPDGRIGFTRKCTDPINIGDTLSINAVAVNPDTGEVEVLSELKDKLFPLEISWNPNLTRAITSQSSRICASLSWVTREGPEDIPLEMGKGKNKWRLDEELHSDECKGGRADSPSWSPNGKHIAFFASPPSGREGFSRLNKPWDLYLMDPKTLELETLVKGVRSAHSPTWSPDNRWIAYIAEGRGILLVSTKGGKPKYISKMPAGELAWSPNGDELAFRVKSDPGSIEDFSTKIFIMDVSELSK